MAFRHNYDPRLRSLPHSPKTGNDGHTILMLHMDGSDGSTTFTDECNGTSAHTVTANGNAQVDTAQSKFGGASCRLDGTNAWLNLDGSSDYAFGTGDWTIDFWMRLASYTAGTASLYDGRSEAQGAYPWLGFLTSKILRYYVSSLSRIETTTLLALDTWYHICLARAGGNTKCFVNGIQEGPTYSDGTNYLNTAGRPRIGTSGFAAFPEHPDCWMEEFRISKGIARWKENFTPPTAPYERKILGTRQSYGSFQKFKLKRAA